MPEPVTAALGCYSFSSAAGSAGAASALGPIGVAVAVATVLGQVNKALQTAKRNRTLAKHNQMIRQHDFEIKTLELKQQQLTSQLKSMMGVEDIMDFELSDMMQTDPDFIYQDVDIYTIQAGDTLSGIAQNHGTDWQKLFRVNQFSSNIYDPNKILPGQTIIVPKVQRPTTTQRKSLLNPKIINPKITDSSKVVKSKDYGYRWSDGTPTVVEPIKLATGLYTNQEPILFKSDLPTLEQKVANYKFAILKALVPDLNIIEPIHFLPVYEEEIQHFISNPLGSNKALSESKKTYALNAVIENLFSNSPSKQLEAIQLINYSNSLLQSVLASDVIPMETIGVALTKQLFPKVFKAIANGSKDFVSKQIEKILVSRMASQAVKSQLDDLGGKILTPNLLKKYMENAVKLAEKHGIPLETIFDENLDALGKLSVLPNKARLIFRDKSRVSKLTFQHELWHLEDFLANPKKYYNISKTTPWVHEEAVWERIYKTKHKWTEAELVDAYMYYKDYFTIRGQEKLIKMNPQLEIIQKLY